MRQEELFRPLTDDIAEMINGLRPEDVQPRNGWVVCILLPELIETKGGIILPDASRKRPPFGRIAAVPDDPKCPCKPGDWVMFHPGTGMNIGLLDEEGKPREDIVLVGYTDDLSSEIIFTVAPEALKKPLTPTPEPSTV